jgi:pyruvate-formate lyase
VSRFWTEESFKHTSPTGKRYRSGYLSWNYWIAYAPTTAATPDGRRRGQFLSNAVCPVNGADRQGPTSVIKSVGKLELETAPNGASHAMSFSPGLLRGSEQREKLKALLRAYGRVGGTCLQVNVIDANTLREAQQHPDEYRNLLVRVMPQPRRLAPHTRPGVVRRALRGLSGLSASLPRKCLDAHAAGNKD